MIDQTFQKLWSRKEQHLLCAERKVLSNITFRKEDQNVYFKELYLLAGKQNKMINLEPFLRGMIKDYKD